MEHKKNSRILMPQEGSYAIRDRVIGFGEKMSGYFTEIHLKKEGYQAHFFDSVECDPEELNGGGVISNRKLHAAMRSGIKTVLEGYMAETSELEEDSRRNIIKIFGGHIANTPRGIAIDVGRSYTDTTAVNVALVIRELIGNATATFWKDVDGVMSANPKELKNPGAAIIHDKVDIREGLEAAAAGSQLMQVDALALAEEHKLDLRLQNIKNPEAEQGTDFVNIRVETGLPCKMIIANSHIDSVTITMPQMANKVGFGHAITGILKKHGISYDINPMGGTSMTFTIPLPQDKSDSDRKAYRRTRIKPALDEMKKLEVEGEIYEMQDDPIWVEDARSTISVIGNELKNQRGVLARITTALGRAEIDIKGISQDENQARVTLLIEGKEGTDAVNALHDELFEQAA